MLTTDEFAWAGDIVLIVGDVEMTCGIVLTSVAEMFNVDDVALTGKDIVFTGGDVES